MRHAIPTDLTVNLDRQSRLTLARQLYEELRGMILSGRLAAGSAMPSSRVLAKTLNIARSTVIETYDVLKEQGYIESKNGSSTYVSRSLPARPAPPPVQEPLTVARSQALLAGCSSYAKRLANIDAPYEPAPDLEICFYPWRIARDATSLRLFTQTQAKVSRTAPLDMLDYPEDQLGYKPLRETIARSLYRWRGIKCGADQVIILTGLPQAINLTARIHIDRGDLVAVENPLYPPVFQTFELEGATLCPIPVDDYGMRVDLLVNLNQKIRLVYTTPTHQFPTGARLSLNRRLELLAWANHSGTFFIEDEHDSEFAYGNPVPALKALDTSERVIFQGTFAKTLFPSLALAYLVLPEGLVDIYTRARELSSDQIPILVQAALRDLMHSGLLSRHVRRMRSLYAQRRNALLQAINTHLHGLADVCGYESGLHVLLRSKTGIPTEEILKRAQEAGVGLISTWRYYTGLHESQLPQGEFVLGYADLTESRIEEGIKRLAGCLR